MLYRNTAGYIDASMVQIADGLGLEAGSVYAFVQRTSDSKWLQANLSWNVTKPTTTAIPTMTHVSGGHWKLAHTPADADDTYFINCIDSGATCFPDNYEVTVAGVGAKEATLVTVSAYIDTEIQTIIDAIAALQADLGDPSAAATTIYARLLAISASLSTLQTTGGVITALVDIGAEISSALLPIVMEKNEKKIITLQVLEGGVAKDCTGLTAKFGVKEKLTDTTYKIGLLDGVFSNDSNGVLSILTFTILPAATTALAAFGGLYSAALYDGAGENKTPLTERGGVAFTLKEDILDV